MYAKKPTLLRHARRNLLAFMILMAACVAAPFASAEDFSAIRKRQARIQKVLKENMSAVVAVTDGIGFGSGVIVSKDGLVLTAGHVMANSGNNYKVILSKRQRTQSHSASARI